MSNEPTLRAAPDDDATMLATEAGPGGERTIAAPTPPGPERAPRRDPRAIPERLGRYRVLDILGQGGMGVVYTAYDPELDRKVAIKLLRSSASPSAKARLQREAQAMAKLSHPNVVPVFDVGTVADQVFIAMDYVEGQDLRGWLDAEDDRDWREVLEVFLDAGRGLAYAHQSEIVHRDFKPDNVLVSTVGGARRVQVLDFGLAKSLAPVTGGLDPSPPPPAAISSGAGTSQTLPAVDLGATDVDGGGRPAGPGRVDSKLSAELTRAGAVMGTPAYMSPEQHHGVEVGAASDQFSFCVALFEGLWGRRPFPGETLAELAFSVVRGKLVPPPASSKVPARLWPIIERGLQTQPADRWPSMDALLDALADDPSGRRRMAGFAGLALVAVAGAFSWGLHQASSSAPAAEAPRCANTDAPLRAVWGPRQRDELAARYAAIAEGQTWATPVQRVVAGELDNWASEWAAGRADACAATRIRAEQSSELMDLRMACYARKLGELSATIDLLTTGEDPPLAKGVELASALPALEPCADAEALRAVVPPPTPAVAAEVEALHARLAEARSRARAGEAKAALALAEQLTDEVAATDYRPLAAELGLAHGSLLLGAGRHDEGKAAVELAFGDALAVRDDDLAGRACEELVFAIGYTDGDYEGGMRWARIGEALLARSDEPRLRREAALASRRGMAELAANNFEAAREQTERALAISIELDGEDHPGLVNELDTLGAIHLRRGEYEDAGEYFRRTVALAERGYGPEHVKVAFPLNNLALVHERLAQFDAAADAFSRVIDILAASSGDDHPNVGLSRMNLGGVLMLAGRQAEAASEIDAAVDILERALGPDHQAVARALTMRSDLERSMGELEAAIASARRAKAIRRETLGSDHPDLGLTMLSLGQSLIELERFADAVVELERAAELLDSDDADPIDRGLARWKLARALDGAGGRDPDRIASLIAEARADLRAGEVRAKADLDALEAWAAARGAGRARP